ncbi:hypothetical protein FGO68_gene16204 [Halteria grandinella]|uniref:Uncharacterized protein n=1 Tax=Halteria grandinella TaxID=5974 RepID=A0A8J8NVY4_HALGN|nr:hypothetical protein FGO68_gene16204 [Halteria grandinella]
MCSISYSWLIIAYDGIIDFQAAHLANPSALRVPSNLTPSPKQYNLNSGSLPNRSLSLRPRVSSLLSMLIMPILKAIFSIYLKRPPTWARVSRSIFCIDGFSSWKQIRVKTVISSQSQQWADSVKWWK